MFRLLQVAEVGDGRAAYPFTADVGYGDAVQAGEKSSPIRPVQFYLTGVRPRFLENPLEEEAEAVPICNFDKETEGLIDQVAPGYS